MALPDLDRWLRTFAAACAPLLVGACNRIDASQFTVDVCSNGLDILATVEPADPVDYLELRAVPDPGTFEDIDTLDAVGTACAGASDRPACLDALATVPNDSSLSPAGSFDAPESQSLAWTRGDDVGAVLDEAALRDFLGAIDTPGDAALYGRLLGHDLRCGEPAQVGEHAEGWVLYTSTGTGCGKDDDVRHHVVLVRTDATIQVLRSRLIERGDPGCAIGRLPPGLCRARPRPAAGPVGAFFADVARLEAASVPAFAQLARELAVHRAPAPLVRAALRARDDERRHARVTARLARRHGGAPTPPRVRKTPPRPLVDVLADNAAEGCVRETFGAMVARVQARRAADPEVRRALAGIAADEARHAALSWSLAGWARARLRPAERRRVDRAAADAVDRLAADLVRPHHPQVHALAGLPAPAEAAALYARLHGLLRAAA